MHGATGDPGPYTLSFLLAEAKQQLPALLAQPGLLRRPTGPDRVGGRQKIAAWLRLSRLEGCPVCVNLIPALARRKGFDSALCRSAMDGQLDALSPDLAAAVAYAEVAYGSRGEAPGEVPEAAMDLTAAQRAHLEAFVRLERVVHATGLLFLPHGWIRRAAGL